MADLPQQGESLPDLELTTESGEHIGTGELTGRRPSSSSTPRTTPRAAQRKRAPSGTAWTNTRRRIYRSTASRSTPPNLTASSARSTVSTSHSSPTREAALRRPSGCYARTGRGRNASPSCSTRKAGSPRSTPKSRRNPRRGERRLDIVSEETLSLWKRQPTMSRVRRRCTPSSSSVT